MGIRDQMAEFKFEEGGELARMSIYYWPPANSVTSYSTIAAIRINYWPWMDFFNNLLDPAYPIQLPFVSIIMIT